MQQECQNNPLLSRRFSTTAANSARSRGEPQPAAPSEMESLLPTAALSHRQATPADNNNRVGSGPRWRQQEPPPEKNARTSRRSGDDMLKGVVTSPPRTSSRLQQRAMHHHEQLVAAEMAAAAASPAALDSHSAAQHHYVLHPAINNLSFGNLNSRCVHKFLAFVLGDCFSLILSAKYFSFFP
jgi:hypothetical protein